MRVIGLVNQKGGVAKTTTASALAYGLARQGKKTLLVDFDPQGNLSVACGITTNEGCPPALKLITDIKSDVKIERLEICLDFIASGIGLETANMILAGKPCRELYLKRALQKFEGQYDYVVVDSNPSLSIITLNVLAACDDIIVPFKPEFNSEKGVSLLIETVDEIHQINKDLCIRGFLVTMADRRRRSTNESVEYVEKQARNCQSKVYRSWIRQSVVAADAPKNGKSVYAYRPGSPLVTDYETFVEEFLNEKKEYAGTRKK
ncbi:MAG: ParA family protein [Clostridia bacterium]|nr:ParA family protein [Clostridia bacterium]